MKLRILLISVLVALILPGSAVATTIYVDDDNTTGPWDGSAANPFQYIQHGINAAISGVDTVLVRNGTYTGALNKDLNFGGKAITVTSESGPYTCIIDCQDSGRGFLFNSGEGATSVVDGFTITDGAVDDGGGISCISSSPTITDCVITGNSASDNGGGIYCVFSSHATITNCTISGNEATDLGGGVVCLESSNPNFSGCTITGNSAGIMGGGFYWYNSSPTLTDCTVADNVSDGAGGGIVSYSSSATITNCRVRENSASSSGGGIRCFYDGATITNCIVSSNSGWNGGGIECTGGSPAIANCTVSGNTATGSGGGIYSSSTSTPAITNCIVWGNTPTEVYVGSGGTPTVTYCDVQGGWAGTGNIDADPLFIDAKPGLMIPSFMNWRLRPGSPCIDAATSAAPAPATDIDGRARYDDPTTTNTGGGASPYYDIGAHEFKAYYVNGDPGIGNDAYDGLEPVYNIATGHGPELTIQAGINDAADGDVVSVAPWTYTGANNRGLNLSGKAVALISEQGAASTIIDCEGADQGVHLTSGEPRTAVIDGFTITNGGSVNYGGGIACWLGSTPTILNCVVTDCTVVSSGGAVCFDRSPARIVNCSLIGNTAGQYGGGIECYDTYAYIERCTVMGNTAGWDGGGIRCLHSTQLPHIDCCVIARNSTSASGGGIYTSGSTAYIMNCTIANNTAVSGGGWYCASGSPIMTNCILWDDGPDELAGAGTPYLYSCDVQGGWAGGGGDNFDAAPRFLYPRADKYRLRPGSPCVDSGSGTESVPVIDIEGRPRYDDPMVTNTGAIIPYYDIGAYELKCYYVDDGIGNDAWSGLMPYWDGTDGPKETIQAGIDSAADGDTVVVAPGTYTGAGNYDLDFGGKPITLMAPGGASSTTINADGAGRVLDFASGETGMAIVLGFTASKGFTSGGTGFGGCIQCDASSPSILACRVVGGASDYGGGIGCLHDSNAVILDCEIDHNVATFYGGGIECQGGSPVITNCLIHSNEAGDTGGGIDCWAAPNPTITQCTLSLNTAGTTGGGIYAWSTGGTIRDCILWGDTPDEFNRNSTTPTLTYCDVENGTGEAWFGTGCLDKDPLFVSGPLHDYYLSQVASGQGSDSACVDAGSDTAANLEFDELTTRTDGVYDSGQVDMGYHCRCEIWITDVYWDQAAGAAKVTFTTTPGEQYTVEKADADAYSDALTWIPLVNFTAAASEATVSDTGFPLPNAFRFYRVRRTDGTAWSRETAGVFEMTLTPTVEVGVYFISTPLVPDTDHDTVAQVFGENGGRQIPRANFTVTDLDETTGLLNRMRNASGTFSVIAGSAFDIEAGRAYELLMGLGPPISYKLRLTGYVPEQALSVDLTKTGAQAVQWMAYSMPRTMKLSQLGIETAIVPWIPTNQVRLLPPGSAFYSIYTCVGGNWVPSDPDLEPGMGIEFLNQGPPGGFSLTESTWYFRPPNDW